MGEIFFVDTLNSIESHCDFTIRLKEPKVDPS